jgi:hypothetical protein
VPKLSANVLAEPCRHSQIVMARFIDKFCEKVMPLG